MLTRRQALFGLVAAPAIIRVAPLMAIKPVELSLPPVLTRKDFPVLARKDFQLIFSKAYSSISEELFIHGKVIYTQGADGFPEVVRTAIPFDTWRKLDA